MYVYTVDNLLMLKTRCVSLHHFPSTQRAPEDLGILGHELLPMARVDAWAADSQGPNGGHGGTPIAGWFIWEIPLKKNELA